MKLSGELPLTAFFPLADKPRNRRRVNTASASNNVPGKRKGTILQPENTSAKRPKHHLDKKKGGDAGTSDGKHLQSFVSNSHGKSSNSTASKKSLLSRTPASICDPIEISDDEERLPTVYKQVSEFQNEDSIITHTPAVSSPIDSREHFRLAKQVLSTSPGTIRPNRATVTLSLQAELSPCSCSSYSHHTNTGPCQNLDTDAQERRLQMGHNNKTDDLEETIVPTSQPMDYEVPDISRSQVCASVLSPTFKIPGLPVALHSGSYSPVIAISPAKDSYVPSSQTQSMIVFDTSPCRHKNSRISATVVASPLRIRGPFPPDGIVQSSQSQVERDISVATIDSPMRPSFTGEVETSASLLRSALTNLNPEAANLITYVPETHDIFSIPNSDSPSQHSSVIYTSPIRCPSQIAAALDSDDEEISCLPTSLQNFDGTFNYNEATLSQTNNFNPYHPSPSTYPTTKDLDSATESDTEDDEPANVTLREDDGVDSERLPIFSADSWSPSAPHHEFYSSENFSTSFSDSFDVEYATSPIAIPADLTFNSDSMTLDDESLRSLPSPVKRFRDMFTGSDSCTSDSPSSAGHEDQDQCCNVTANV